MPKSDQWFELKAGKEPHIRLVYCHWKEQGWTNAVCKYEIHKLDNGYVLCGGITGKPLRVFVAELELMSYLKITCGEYRETCKP